MNKIYADLSYLTRFIITTYLKQFAFLIILESSNVRLYIRILQGKA